MYAFGRLFLKTLNRRRCISSFSLRSCASVCAGNFDTVDFNRQSILHALATRTCLGQLSAPVRHDHPRRYNTLHKTQCDVHKFGKLRLTVGSSCNVTVSSLNPQLHIDQNLVIVTDAASRLSVEYHNSDGISHVSVSESKDRETRKESRQQSDVCNVEVPIKYGSLCHLL